MSEASTEQVNPEQPPLATLNGQEITDLPADLYIPPEALQVFLEAFTGPMDLLLYLIKKQNIDILDLPIADITRQYMDYVELMKDLQLELAADYLVMAAMLAEIKSRMLLPRPTEEDDEEDPRAELVRRLQEYERFKKAAQELDNLPRRERDTFAASAEYELPKEQRRLPDIDLNQLLYALRDVMKQAQLRTHHHVEKETLSLRSRMTSILELVNGDDFIPFQCFFNAEEGKAGVVVTFIAILELLKGAMIEIVQAELFGPIHIRAIPL